MKDRSMRSLRTITLLALISSTAFAFTPALAVDAKNSALCGPDAPEGYKRPGGYCDQLGAKSLASSDSQSAESPFANDGPEDQ
jgi:hypothetical protein